MALKLVMEPIFESGFYASSYAYRPGRRTQDAIAETHHLTTRSYEWIVETDVEACFDRLSHSLIGEEVRRRIGDKRVQWLVQLFLKAGLMTETGRLERTVTGTPRKAGSPRRCWRASPSPRWTANIRRTGRR